MKNYFYRYRVIWLFLGAVTALAANGRFLKIAQSMENFALTYRIINNEYVDETDPNQLMRVGIDSMLATFDPYTNYFSSAQMVQVRMGVKGGWDGIGVELISKKDQIVIGELIGGTPAEKNDLRVGDVLLKIDGTTIQGRPLNDVSKTLQGKSGTEVTIEVLRPSSGQQRTLTLERTKVTKDNVPYYGMLDEKTGYIVLTTFSQKAGKNVQKALEALKAEHNPKQLILDLRGNGGGFLIEAVNICNLFLSKGNEIVYTKSKIPEWDRSFKTLNPPIDLSIPLIVLINGRSASASEIVAGALQDFDRAVLLGRNSFGKGLVQNTKDVGYNSKIKLTTAKYYIPSGRCVQALNYKNGKPVKVPDSLRQAFQTKAGRTVYDGKGLEPDFDVEEKTKSTLLNVLLKEQIIFDYANKYRNEHDTIVTAKKFALSNQEYQEFVKEAMPFWMTYKTSTEKTTMAFEAQAKAEGNYQALAAHLNQAQQLIEQEKKEAFEVDKKAIKEVLEEEIVRRYYYQTGQIENRLARDSDVAAALELFKNQQQFQQLLRPQ